MTAVACCDTKDISTGSIAVPRRGNAVSTWPSRLGHLATFHDRHAVYEVFADEPDVWKVEKYRDDILEVALVVRWDGKALLCDPRCTAGRFGKRCHHLDKVREAVLHTEEGRWNLGDSLARLGKSARVVSAAVHGVGTLRE
jgi:hypothetical protein